MAHRRPTRQTQLHTPSTAQRAGMAAARLLLLMLFLPAAADNATAQDIATTHRAHLLSRPPSRLSRPLGPAPPLPASDGPRPEAARPCRMSASRCRAAAASSACRFVGVAKRWQARQASAAAEKRARGAGAVLLRYHTCKRAERLGVCRASASTGSVWRGRQPQHAKFISAGAVMRPLLTRLSCCARCSFQDTH